ncbi:MAG: alpha/beta fold hydrolase, partial [Selenomonadaceae bacterium]|nr:alpha/beta fold hydrolase [Selenomonadaceae bacterium]
MIEGGNPFFMGGGSSGVLLVHGFTGLPAELFLLGEFLNRQNFTVLCPRLAGHGTDENDLMRTTKDDWFNSVLDGFHILRGVCEKIFVVGHSMGGLLTLKLAAEKNLAKIVTLAAPIFIDDGLGLKNLPPKEFCGNACIVQPRRKLNDVPQAANEVYKKTPLVSVHELVGLIDDAKNFLPKVTAPILIMHGEDDHTAQPRSA